MKRFAALFIIVIYTLSAFATNSFCLEALSDSTMSNISGQATGFSEDNEHPVYNTYSSNLSYNYLGTDEQRRSSFPGEHNGTHKTILLDFIGKDATDTFGNTYRAPFYTDMHVGDITYEDKDSNAFAILEGYANGFVEIPESYGLDSDGNLRFTKTVSISNSSIPLDLDGTNYICSYQGNIFTPESIENLSSEKTSFEIYPNRNSQTIGEAIGGDLTILIPYEKADGTFGWGIGAIIPEGKRYIHIDLNRMNESRTILYSIKLANNPEGVNDPIDTTQINPAESTSNNLRCNTLGTAFVDTSMSILGGSVFITID